MVQGADPRRCRCRIDAFRPARTRRVWHGFGQSHVLRLAGSRRRAESAPPLVAEKRLAHCAPGQNADACLADSVVEVLRIAKQLHAATSREDQMLIHDERRGRAKSRLAEHFLAVAAGAPAARALLAFAAAAARAAARQLAVAVGVVGGSADERERVEAG